MDTPKVTIGVPIYNVSKYIERCAVSLLEQTYDNIQFIFINDQTPDNSIDILKDVISRYPNRREQITIIDHHHNRGLSATRNTTIEFAKGEFIMWCDSDDWLNIHAVEHSINKQQETNADIVSFRTYKHCDGDIRILNEEISDDHELMLENLIYKGVNHVWARLIRLSLYLDNNIRAKEGINMGEDYQVIIPLFYYAQKIASIPTALYYYESSNVNSYTASLLSIKNQQQIQDSYTIVDEFLLSKDNKYKDSIEKRNLKKKILAVFRAKYANEEDFDYIKSRSHYYDCLPIKQKILVNIKCRKVLNFILRIC